MRPNRLKKHTYVPSPEGGIELFAFVHYECSMHKTHPILRFAQAHGLKRKDVFDRLEIPQTVGRKLVLGLTRASWSRARGWEAMTAGEISASEVMDWQLECDRSGHNKGGDDERAD